MLNANNIENISNITNNNYSNKQLYLEQLSDTEKKIIMVAEEVLGSSFDIYRSIGFIEWKINNGK